MREREVAANPRCQDVSAHGPPANPHRSRPGILEEEQVGHQLAPLPATAPIRRQHSRSPRGGRPAYLWPVVSSRMPPTSPGLRRPPPATSGLRRPQGGVGAKAEKASWWRFASWGRWGMWMLFEAVAALPTPTQPVLTVPAPTEAAGYMRRPRGPTGCATTPRGHRAGRTSWPGAPSPYGQRAWSRRSTLEGPARVTRPRRLRCVPPARGENASSHAGPCDASGWRCTLRWGGVQRQAGRAASGRRHPCVCVCVGIFS